MTKNIYDGIFTKHNPANNMSDENLDVLAKAIRLMKDPTKANVKKAHALMDVAGDIESKMIADLFDSDPSKTFPL